MLGSRLAASLGAYALASLRWWEARALAAVVLITYLVLGIRWVIPMDQRLGDLHRANSVRALTASYPSFILPRGAWLLMVDFRSIPEELEEVARMATARFAVTIEDSPGE